MDIFNGLTMLGGLSLFLFGMSIMGQALERRAGGKLRALLGKFTTGRVAGLLTGLGVTAVIQSSSATTVMVVGFVNSGLMTLRQAVNVIMGANVGTTVTAWILSLAGIDSSSWYIRLLKPSSFTPLLAFSGIILYMFIRDEKKKDTGTVLLGFATLMFGMETMSGAVSALAELPAFREMFVMFENPVMGVLAGAILTAVIQSSSASVGILQALAVSGKISYGAAIPIIMGQNIGTCVTAMISSVGANKNAKRAALVHLSFNCIGTAVWITVYCAAREIFRLHFLDGAASLFGIAACHSVFNILCMMLMLPLSGTLERLVTRLVPDERREEEYMELDERFFTAPSIALERCQKVTGSMAETAVESLKEAVAALEELTPQLASSIRLKEEKTDYYEDVLNTYLVKLSARQISSADSMEAAKLLKIIGDFERISDHAVNLLRAAEEMSDKERTFTDAARRELKVLCGAVGEVLDLTLSAFLGQDLNAAMAVEPLEQVIDRLKEEMRTRHIRRMQQGGCSITAGFVWSDLLTDLERTADHCSNVAGCMLDTARQNMNLHEAIREFKDGSEEFRTRYREFEEKYTLD